MWLFSQRFPVLFFLTLVPILRFPTGARGALVTVAALAVAVGSTVNVCKHFIQFQLEEVGDLDEAIEHIPPAKKVAALIYDKTSSVVNWAPFLHFGSYYQAQKRRRDRVHVRRVHALAVQLQSGHSRRSPAPARPPAPALGVDAGAGPSRASYPCYDYVLTRGSGFRPPPGTFHPMWHGDSLERLGDGDERAERGASDITSLPMQVPPVY